MDYKKGSFQQYVAKKATGLGGLDAIGKTIKENQIVEFDGTTIVVEGEEYKYPKLRLAIKAGWFVPYTQDYVPTPTFTEEPPRKMSFDVASEEEKLVLSLEDANLGQRDGKLVETMGITMETRTVDPRENPPLPISQPDLPGTSFPLVRESEGLPISTDLQGAIVVGNIQQDSDENQPVLMRHGTDGEPVKISRSITPAISKSVIDATGVKKTANSTQLSVVRREDSDNSIVGRVGSPTKSETTLTSGEEEVNNPVQFSRALPPTQTETLLASEEEGTSSSEGSLSNGQMWDVKGVHWTKRLQKLKTLVVKNPNLVQEIYHLETDSMRKRIQTLLQKSG